MRTAPARLDTGMRIGDYISVKTLVSAGLPYINGVKHLGNLVGSMLPADVYSRFLRQRGEEVLYVCGTDEHGAPAELAAEKAGEAVESYCARMHTVQADIYERFGLQFDHFGRTSAPQNHELTKEIFSQLWQEGHITGRSIRQYFSPTENRYLADRYIIGTCPKCSYERARGDQCENCTRLLDPTDLIDPRSALSGQGGLELRETEQLFLNLPKLQERVGDWVRDQDQWPQLSTQIARKWLNEGLQERCITRNLEWGVKAPVEGYEDLVLYVWFDAPIGYIGITKELFDAKGEPDGWSQWWKGAEDVRYVQFMGKDNLPFHTLMFPAMLLGTGADWKLPDQIKGFHWLDYYGGKFSTSLGRGVFTDAAADLYPSDYWRYYLMANVPETGDATFTWTSFVQTVNKDLAGVLGNFVNRILRFTEKKFGSQVPSAGAPGTAEAELQTRCREFVETYETSMEALEMRAAMRALRGLWVAGNKYIDERAPWKLIKTEPEQAEVAIRTGFNLAALFAAAAHPIIPDSATRILNALGLDGKNPPAPSELLGLDRVVGGAAFELIPPLFEMIPEEEIESLEARFGT